MILSFSKLWSFSIIHQLTLFWFQLMLYWKWSQFWKNWGSRNCVLKMDGLFIIQFAQGMILCYFSLLCCTKITISKEERNALNMKQIHNVIYEEKWENKMLIMNWIIDLVRSTMAGINTFCPKIILPLLSIKIWFRCIKLLPQNYFFTISKF